MKISITIELESENSKDMKIFHSLNDLISNQFESINLRASYSDAWRKCSWEVIALAVTVLAIADGESEEKGVYALFDTLCSPEAEKTCGALTERGISSRVGRTAVICKQMGDFRLMKVAVRKNDKAKRVYVVPEAKEALLKLLKSDWGRELDEYLEENGLEAVDYGSL